jgi:hypothetical protein
VEKRTGQHLACEVTPLLHGTLPLTCMWQAKAISALAAHATIELEALLKWKYKSNEFLKSKLCAREASLLNQGSL